MAIIVLMKKLLFALILIITCSVKAANVSNAASSYDRNYEAAIEIQMEAEKANNVFVSKNNTEKILTYLDFEFALNPSRDIYEISTLKRYMLYQSQSESVLWSTALAGYRFAKTDNERLRLINSLIAAAIYKSDFISTNSILDCENSRVKLDMPAEGSQQLNLSFHPVVSRKDILRDRPLDLRMNVYDAKHGNIAIREFYDSASEVSKKQGKRYIRGILYAWLPDSEGGPALLQSCDITESI
jgi:hypothetical protein